MQNGRKENWAHSERFVEKKQNINGSTNCKIVLCTQVYENETVMPQSYGDQQKRNA